MNSQLYPQYRMVETPTDCGGTKAWERRHGDDPWEMTGCVCHHRCDGEPLDKARATS